MSRHFDTPDTPDTRHLRHLDTPDTPDTQQNLISTRRAGYVDTLLVFPSTPASHMASTAVRYPTPQRVDGSTQHTSVEVTDPLLCQRSLERTCNMPQIGVDMEAQKCLRNSGFLPPLAADGVYDHNCAVPNTVRHAGRPQERPARRVRQLAFKKKNVPIQPWLTWLSLLALGCS